MLLTPTYHVFEMYKGHQDARHLESYAETSLTGEGEECRVPSLHLSASQAADGGVLVTVANLDDTAPAPVDFLLAGLGKAGAVSGRVLSGKRDACNTFDAPEKVKPAALEGVALTENGFRAVLPPCCVAAFQVTPQ